MALSNITVKGITPDLSVLGGYQRFRFDTDPLSKLQSFNSFTPINIMTDAENNIELRNYLFGGYRFHQASHFDELFYPGTFKFQYFTNDGAGTDIWTYGGDYFRFSVPVQLQPFENDLDMGGFRIINLGAPVNSNDAATKAYVDSATGGGGGAITLTGDVTASGTVGSPIIATLTLTLDQIIAPVNPVDLNSQKIINLAAPVLSTDAANKTYVDSRRLDQIPAPLTDITMNGFRILNVATPIAANDATNKSYVDAKTWTSSQITDFNSAVTAFRLNQFTVPNANVSMGGFKITNLATPTATTDAVTKAYVDSAVTAGTVTLTGNVTGSGVVGTPFATTLTLRLDQIAAPTASVSLNSQKITNLATPTLAGDATNRSYVDGKTWTSSQITDFTSAVTAFRLNQFTVPNANVSMGGFRITNLATPTTTTDATTKAYVDALAAAASLAADYYPPNATFQNFIYTASAGFFRIKNEFVPGASFPSNANLDFINSNSYGFRLNYVTLVSQPTYGVLNIQSRDSVGQGVGTTLLTLTTTGLTSLIPLTMNAAIDMSTANKIVNLAPPTAANDATNKSYVDARRLDQIAAPTASVSLNSQKITNLATPTLANDGVNKSYADALTVLLPSDYTLPNNSYQSFITGGSSVQNNLNLISNYIPLIGFPGSINLNFKNSVSYGYRVNHITGAGETYGTLNIQSTVPVGVGTNLLSITPTLLTISIDANMGSHDLYNVSRLGIGVAAPHGRLHFDNTLENRKIILYETANNLFQFMGFGVTAGSLEYHVDATSSEHTWYAATSSSSSNELFTIKGTGAVLVPTTGILYALRPIGCAYMQGNVTTTTATANVWTKILGATSLTANSLQFTMSANNRLLYGGEQAITAMVSVDANLSMTGFGSVISISIYKNGVQVTPSTITSNVGATNQGILSVSCPVSMTSGDYVEAWIRSNNATTITVSNLITNVTSI